MPKRTTIVPHLSVAELENGYRNCRDATERNRWLIIKLLAEGKTTAQVSQITSTTKGWVCEIARRYNRKGPDGLADLRRDLPGVAPLLSQELRRELAAALQSPPPDGGEWNGVKVARWMSERLGEEIHRQQGWVYLRLLGYTPQTPRPSHIQSATKEERRTFKKKLKAKLREVKKTHPNAKVEVWYEDEHRIGLLGITRRVWAKRGQRPVVRVQPRQEWLYLFGFVRPTTGQTYWLTMPSVNLSVMQVALAEFAKAQDVGVDKQLIVLIDGAAWHTSKKLVIPPGIQLVRLPPYTPELQPAEHLWELTDEGLANRHFKTLAAQDLAQGEWCIRLSQEQIAQVKARTRFRWWPKVA